MTDDHGVSFRAVDHDPDAGTYRAEFAAAVVAPSIAVVSIMELVTGLESTEFDPLYETVDPAALDAVIVGSADGSGDRSVRFEYLDHEVCVHSYGVIHVRPVDDVDGLDR